jgi:cytochrome c556
MSAKRRIFPVLIATGLVIACEPPADRTHSAAVKSTEAASKDSDVDTRTPIVVDATARQAVLSEMQTMLIAVQGIVSGTAGWDTVAIRAAASSAGVRAASEADPHLEATFGADFVQLGMRTHLAFDSIARDVGKDREAVLRRLATVMGNCVGCHSQWRLVVEP